MFNIVGSYIFVESSGKVEGETWDSTRENMFLSRAKEVRYFLLILSSMDFKRKDNKKCNISIRLFLQAELC